MRPLPCGDETSVGTTASMTHRLTEVAEIGVPVESFPRGVGDVFQAFSHQDSGTKSHGDLGEYRDGPFVLEMDRNYGSTCFMAPEEFQRGATIDQVTTVFNLGRAATVLLGDGTESMDAWRGSNRLKDVGTRATNAERSQRHQSVREFVEEWREAVEAK